MASAGVGRAEIVPVTSVAAGVDGTPPYLIESLSVGDYTVPADQLAPGTSTGSAAAGTVVENADDLDLDTIVIRTPRADPVWTITAFGGESLWQDSNGPEPDFFLFEVGMNDPFTMQAILAGGALGEAVSVDAATYGSTGLHATTGAAGGQEIGGVAFGITDLLDDLGNPLAQDAVIEGIQIDGSSLDPASFLAVVAPLPPTTYGSRYVDDALIHYAIPRDLQYGVPIVAIPGLALSSYLYLTTPDGRPGWVDLFADAGLSFYVYNDPLFDFADGFSVGPFVAPEEGRPPADPLAEVSWDPAEIWPRWGFGPEEGVPHEDVRFPTDDMQAFVDAFPRRSASPAGSGRFAANYIAPKLVSLLEQIGPVVLMAHSASGLYAVRAAHLRPDLVVGFIFLEPIGVPGEEDFPAFAHTDLLGIYADYVVERGQENRKAGTEAAAALYVAQGRAGEVISLPEDLEIHGNTHMMMQDNNNDFIADLIIGWITEHMALQPLPTSVKIRRDGDAMVLSYPIESVWEYTDGLEGPWTALPEAASRQIEVTPDQAHRFFRRRDP
jgi:pimeloyl-ACP methyl ester carboxylesterase